MQSSTQQRIEQQLKDHPIVVYMKGTPDFPSCGFSKTLVDILEQYDSISFHAVNILEDEMLRQGIKVYGNFPTIPQLYVHGTLIGGCDIVATLHHQQALQAILEAPATTS